MMIFVRLQPELFVFSSSLCTNYLPIEMIAQWAHGDPNDALGNDKYWRHWTKVPHGSYGIIIGHLTQWYLNDKDERNNDVSHSVVFCEGKLWLVPFVGPRKLVNGGWNGK